MALNHAPALPVDLASLTLEERFSSVPASLPDGVNLGVIAYGVRRAIV